MLQDTSFAIHPGKQTKGTDQLYRDIGRVKSFKMTGNTASLITESGECKIVFYKENIVRFVFNPKGESCLKSSPALIVKPLEVKVSLSDNEASIILETAALKVELQKSPLRMSVSDLNGRLLLRQGVKGIEYKCNGEVNCFFEMNEKDHFYGFGEKTGYLDKRGEKMTMWNTDVYAPHNPETDALYESIPYFMVLRDGQAHGIFFDNTFKSRFDLRSDNEHYSFGAEGGQIDFFVMAGPRPKAVLEQYTALTGRAPIPPKWAIGYHQSRYSYENELEVRDLARTFLEKGIPLDVIYLDIHYMDGYRVFTFDADRFPDPQKLISDLKESGIRVVPIVDPGVKEDPEYETYQEGVYGDMFCKYIEGNIYFGEVWPGNSAFPDFTSNKVREWWGNKHKYYTDLGIEGIWNDMNEPAVFNETKTMDLKVVHENEGHPRTHRELHNIYGLMMGEATYTGMKKQLNGKRPFLLTRAGYSGVQRYAAVWTGDNRSFWEHLQMSLPMVMNLGLSGIPFAGPDVGGFAHDGNGELLARWTQVGAFTPFFRNHSALGFVRQEPWSFGEKYERIIKKYIELRYQWLPHFYTLFAEAHRSGTPVVRPLMLEYPNDPNTFNLSDQIMIGDNVIVAPIMQPSQEHRVVYLPEGNWVDYWTGKVYQGAKHHMIQAGIEVLPIFILQGTMVVHSDLRTSTMVPDQKRILHLYLTAKMEATYTLYDDDGETFAYQGGEYIELTLIVKSLNDELNISMKRKGSYIPLWRDIEVIILGDYVPDKLVINSENQEIANKRAEKTFRIQL